MSVVQRPTRPKSGPKTPPPPPAYDVADKVVEMAVPVIEDRLYFATCARKPASTPGAHFFGVDTVFVYIGYNRDFGPLNLAIVTKYCRKINRKLQVGIDCSWSFCLVGIECNLSFCVVGN